MKSICQICKKEFNGMGHNAQPINDGRCCDNCNMLVIIERLQGAMVILGVAQKETDRRLTDLMEEL